MFFNLGCYCYFWIQYIRIFRLLMKNIFIKLKPTVTLKQQHLRKILSKGDKEQEQSNPLIDSYFEEQSRSDEQAAKFIIKLIEENGQAEVKEKLYPILVYYVANLEDANIRNILNIVYKSSESIYNKVKFFSLVYKSINNIANLETKKWIITRSISLIEQESKISMFSNFVQNFDALISDLTFNANEYAELNLKMINYLQKHLVYKKLWKHYIVQCLLKTQEANAKTTQVDALILKLLKNGDVTQETVSLVTYTPLKSNKFYPFLEHLLLGDFQAFNLASKDALTTSGVNIVELEKNIKIQAIPRILTGIKVASYSQISQILKIKKEEVESYIIEAIQNGLLKAKIDQFQQTILINELKFRALRAQDSASLQKNISTLASKLQHMAKIQ